MNKSDLIRWANISAKSAGHDVSMADTEVVIESFLKGMTLCFDVNEDVLLSGFGKFTVSESPGGERRNPQTGGKITVPAKRTVRFRLSKKVKERLNGEVGEH